MSSSIKQQDGRSSTTSPIGETRKVGCLNCGAPISGKYCGECGQHAQVHRTVGAILHDLLHGVLHFEGRTWRTLPMLAFYPGELTRRYIDGERTRFVSPLALFLFTVFLMFAVFSSIGGPLPAGASTQIKMGMSESAKALRAQISELEQRRAVTASADKPTQELDRSVAKLRGELALTEQIEREGILVGLGHRVVDDLPKSFIRKAVEKFNADPALTLYKLQANAYKFSWLLIPISVPLVWLLFLWRREHWQPYDHTVFVTYSLSFQLLAAIILTILSHIKVPAGLLLTAFAVGTTLHIYRQFRSAYGLSRFSAAWRTAALTAAAGLGFSLFALAMVAIGAAG